MVEQRNTISIFRLSRRHYLAALGTWSEPP